MAWSGHMIDPNEIETRFCIEDGMSFMGSIFTEPSEEALAQIEVVKDYLDCLPSMEADFVELYFFRKLKQTEIALLFGCSQPTVHYRLQRATARIQFLLQLPQVAEGDLVSDLEEFLPDPLDIKIMVGMWKSTCQSEVAKSLGVSQGLVRHRFLRTIKRLREALALSPEKAEAYSNYVDLFEFIAANLNILREVHQHADQVEPQLFIVD